MTTDIKIPIPPSERAELKRRGLSIPGAEKLPSEVLAPAETDVAFFESFDTDALLGHIFPDLAGTTGIDTVKQMMAQNPQGFIDELRVRGRTPASDALLQQFQINPDEVFQEQPADIEPLIKQIWPETNVENFVKFTQETPDLFLESMKSGGRTQPKEQLLTAMGLTWDEIAEVFGTRVAAKEEWPPKEARDYWGNQPIPPKLIEAPYRKLGQALEVAAGHPLFTVKGIPISATELVTAAVIIFEIAMTAPALFALGMEASLKKNLESLWRSTGRLRPNEKLTDVIEPQTLDNFVKWATQNLSKTFLTKNAIKTFFKPVKGGFNFTEAGARATEEAAQREVAQNAPNLMPTFTPGGTAIPGQTVPLSGMMAGARAELPTEIPTQKVWDTMPVPDRVIWAKQSNLEGNVGSKAWQELSKEQQGFLLQTKEELKAKPAKVTPVAPIAPEVEVPRAEAGMPEAGVQETMLPGEVSAKEVFPKGKGKPTQISMDEAAKLRAMEEEAKVRLPVTPEEEATKEWQNRMELEALKEEHAADPASKFVDIVAKSGGYKGKINTLTRTQYRLLTGATWRTQTAEIGGNKVTKRILVGGSEPTPGMMEMEGGISTGKVRWEYALDTVATEQGYKSADEFKVAIQKALERKHLIDQLEGVVPSMPKPTQAQIDKAKSQPLALLPETSLAEQLANITPTGLPKLTMKQVDVLVGFFGEYLDNPNTLTAWELTRELRRETRGQRADLLKARAEELIVSKGLNAEEGMKQAIREALSGELPVMTTGYFEGMVSDLRDALFIKVYNTLKDEPLEMASTITALTNALAGKPIPREPGVKGGSAFTRLQKVFGTQPKVLKAIEKIADEQKPLEKWVEGIYHETGREPIPVDQETADYLRGLSTKVLYEPTAFREPIPVTPYEIPIEEGIKAIPLWPRPASDAIIRVLQELKMSPQDIGGFLKANKSSFDMSYWRQIAPLIAGHPKEFFQSNIDAWKGVISQKSADAQWVRITHDPLYALYDQLQKKDGRDFLRPLTLPKGTSQYKGTEEFGYLTPERFIPRLTGKIPTIKLSNRGFTCGINSDTWRIFKQLYREQLREGEKYASGELKLKPGETFDIINKMDGFATYLADWTGRASLGKFAQAAPAIGNIIYGPRYAWGRAIGPRHLFNFKNPHVMKESWKSGIAFVGVIGGLALLGEELGFWDVDLDRNSADFGKLRIGNRRYDLWGGVQQFFVFYSRLFDIVTAPITGKPATGISSITGAEYPLDINSLVSNLIENKGAPIFALFREYATGKTWSGEPIDPNDWKQWEDRLIPMALGDFVDALRSEPSTAIVSGIASFVGIGVQTYTGDWAKNIPNIGFPKYPENLPYGVTQPVYDWADFYTDTASQFTGVDPATLTEQKGFDPKVVLVVTTARSLEQSSIIPNVTLISMNEDPKKGKTFADFYRIWQEREKIVASGDEKALKEFDADERNNQAYMGNISQRQFALLNEYWSITDKKKREQFLQTHPELSQNPREEWLKSHPEDNAMQAMAGKANVLTQKAYDIAQQLIKTNDIPDNAVSSYLPPKEIAKPYFGRNDIVSKFGANSWEDKLLRAENPKLVDWLNETGHPLDTIDTPPEALRLKIKHRDLYTLSDSYSDKESAAYIAEDKLREKALAQLKKDNPQWVDDMRRVDAIEHNGLDKAEAWVARGKVNDEFTAGSSEAKVWLLDHPDIHKWALEQELLTDDGADWNEAVLRINATWRKQDEEYQAFGDKESPQYIVDDTTREKTRADYLTKNTDFRIVRRQREFYSLVPDTTNELRDKYVAFTELLDKGYIKEHFLLDNPDLENVLTNPAIMKASTRDRIDLATVPDKVYDQLYLKFQGDFDKWEDYGNGASPDYIAGEEERKRARDRLVLNNPDFQKAMWERDAYKLFIGNEGQVDNYVGWQTIADKGKPETADYWFDDNWFLLDHPDFYKAMTDMYVKTDGKQGWKPGAKDKELSRTPTKEVYGLYLVYDAIIGSANMSGTEARKEFRRRYPLLDAWLFLIGAVSKTIEQQDGEAMVTKGETLARKLSEKRLEIDKLRDELDRKLRALGIK